MARDRLPLDFFFSFLLFFACFPFCTLFLLMVSLLFFFLFFAFHASPFSVRSVCSGVSGQALWLDGERAAYGSMSQTDLSNATLLHVGFTRDAGYLVGSLHDVAVWRVALSMVQMTHIQNVGGAQL